MSGRASGQPGRARGRPGPPGEPGQRSSPSPPGGHSPAVSSDDGNSDGIRGRGSLSERYQLLVTRPEGRTSKADNGGGGEVKLFANYFEVKASKDKVLTDYRVDFEPEVELLKARRKMVSDAQAAENLFGGAYVYDGQHNLKSVVKAPQTSTTVTVTNEATREPVKITFRESQEIGWFDEEMLRFLNTQLRRNFDKLKYLLIYRHYFDPDQSIEMPTYKLKIMKGLATAIAHHDGDRLLMVCDTVSKIIQETTVLRPPAKIEARKSQRLVGRCKTEDYWIHRNDDLQQPDLQDFRYRGYQDC